MSKKSPAALLVSACVIAVNAVAAINLLTRNPGFETGTAAGWSLSGECTLVADAISHTGDYGGLVTDRGQPWQGPARLLSQEINLVSDRSYTISVWVRQDQQATADFTLVVKQQDDDGLAYHYIDRVAATRGEWVRLSGTFEYELSGTLEKLIVYVGTVAGAGDDQLEFRVDDAAVSIPGDADGDGDVDLADLADLLAAFGGCAGGAGYDSAADFDSSGCVELADLAVLLGHFGGI